MDRRKFLQATAAAATVSCSAPKTGWRFLSQEEAETLSTICEQIIPADQSPGARWAGVVRYIDRQLTGAFRMHQRTYRDGLAAARRLAGPDLAAALSRDKKLRPFFELVLAHTMQGFYGDPRHGGNRDYVSWRMLGVPTSPVRGRVAP